MHFPDNTNLEFRIPRSDVKIRHASNPDIDLNTIRSPEEAAKKFEKILVQQFVQVMTEQMFESNLSGEDGPGWMKAYGNQQRDTMTKVLTDHLVEKGTFDISSTILKQWQDRGLQLEDSSM